MTSWKAKTPEQIIEDVKSIMHNFRQSTNVEPPPLIVTTIEYRIIRRGQNISEDKIDKEIEEALLAQSEEFAKLKVWSVKGNS